MPAFNATENGNSTHSFSGETAGSPHIFQPERSGANNRGLVVSKTLDGQKATKMGQAPLGCNRRRTGSNRPCDGTADYVGMRTLLTLGIMITLLATTATAGPPWGCYLDFNVMEDGTGDYVDAGTGASLGVTTMSISAWVKPIAYNSGINIGQVIAGSYSNNQGYIFYLNGPQAFPGLRLHDGSDACASAVATSSLNLNEWSHVVGTYDGTDTNIYVNGTKSATAPCNSPVGRNALLIGNTAVAWSGSYFNGSIEDVRLWDTALTEANIQTLFEGDEDTAVGNPAGHWKFNECSGQTVADSNTSNANNGTLGANSTAGADDANWVSQPKNAPFGGYLEFDGTADYVEIPHSSDLNIASTISIEAWINVVASPSEIHLPIVSKTDTSSSDLRNYDFRMVDRSGENHALEFVYRDIANTAWTEVHVSGDTTVKPTQWTHVAVSQNYGVTNSMQIYMNGVSQTLNWNSGDGSELPYTSNFPLRIGRTGGMERYFQGSIDEVRISNTARDIETDWNAGLYETELIVDANTVALWHFNEGSGQYVLDANVDGNHSGTLGASTDAQQTDPIWRGASASLSNAPAGTVFGDAAGNTTSTVTSEATLLVSGVPRVKFRAGTNMDLTSVTFAQNSTKTVVKDLNTVAGIASPTFTLYVPRTIAGGVDVCPFAAALADLNGSCTDAVTWTDTEANSVTTKTVKGRNVTVSTITLNGAQLYMIDGVTGTGGEEGGESGLPELPGMMFPLFVVIIIASLYLMEGKGKGKELKKTLKGKKKTKTHKRKKK